MTKRERLLIQIRILKRAIEKDLENTELSEREVKNLRRMIRELDKKEKELEDFE